MVRYLTTNGKLHIHRLYCPFALRYRRENGWGLERRFHMKVVVQDNQIEKAIRDLKKKLTKEGFFSEIKERRFYDKPSVQKKKKQAKAAKRRRKRMRKVY